MADPSQTRQLDQVVQHYSHLIQPGETVSYAELARRITERHPLKRSLIQPVIRALCRAPGSVRRPHF